jgi:hypothetical protein
MRLAIIKVFQQFEPGRMVVRKIVIIFEFKGFESAKVGYHEQCVHDFWILHAR